jgi:hypothetical protein
VAGLYPPFKQKEKQKARFTVQFKEIAVDVSIEEKIQTYLNLKLELQPLINGLQEMENDIKASILETGEIPEVPGIKIKIRKAYTRSSWDNKGLRGYAVAHPEVMGFVKETSIKPGVSIKVESL